MLARLPSCNHISLCTSDVDICCLANTSLVLSCVKLSTMQETAITLHSGQLNHVLVAWRILNALECCLWLTWLCAPLVRPARTVQDQLLAQWFDSHQHHQQLSSNRLTHQTIPQVLYSALLHSLGLLCASSTPSDAIVWRSTQHHSVKKLVGHSLAIIVILQPYPTQLAASLHVSEE